MICALVTVYSFFFLACFAQVYRALASCLEPATAATRHNHFAMATLCDVHGRVHLTRDIGRRIDDACLLNRSWSEYNRTRIGDELADVLSDIRAALHNIAAVLRDPELDARGIVQLMFHRDRTISPETTAKRVFDQLRGYAVELDAQVDAIAASMAVFDDIRPVYEDVLTIRRATK